MEKKDKTKVLGISLMLIGCLMVAFSFMVVIDWKLMVLIILVGGGCYIVKLGFDYVGQSNQPVNEVKKPDEL